MMITNLRTASNTGRVKTHAAEASPSGDVKTKSALSHYAPVILEIALVGIVGVKLWSLCEPDVRFLTKKLKAYMVSTSSAPSLNPTVQRSQFQSTELVPAHYPRNHSHAKSAASRTTGSYFCETVARNMGCMPFFYQMSLSDQRHGRKGNREAFWGKDLTAETRDVEPEKTDVEIMIDVDYYVDMPQRLAKDFRPRLIYTFQPSQAARADGEYSYTFLGDGAVKYLVSGGATYQHKIWDYGHDSMVVSAGLHTSYYLIDRRNIDDDHVVVCLTPVRKWWGLKAILARYLFSAPPLVRLNPVVGNFVRLMKQTRDGLRVSTGRVGAFISGELSQSADEALAVNVRTTKTRLTLPGIMKFFEGEQLINRTIYASAFLDFHRAGEIGGAYVFPVEEAVRTYTFNPANYNGNKPGLTAFMSPLVNGAFSPSMDAESEKVCISERITKIQIKPGALKFDMRISKHMDEFIEFVVGDAKLIPKDIDAVMEKQSRPSQQHILHSSFYETAIDVIKAFIKREAYANVKDPRNISTINGVVKRDYSMYIYAVADLLKTHDWYAFGKTPREIANRVAVICSQAETVVPSDFSRFDGRISDIFRILERRFLLRAFDTVYADEVSDLHKRQYNVPGVGTHGTKYDPGTSRASGSPETSSFNSLDNAFVAYHTFRCTRVDGKFYSPEAAWKALGIYGGDDGLTADLNPKVYHKCATELGCLATLEIIPRGEPGVNFLARYYGPDVWNGDENSCCDILRQVSKFHTTTKLPDSVTPVDKLLEKSRAYYLTDRNTPIIGPLVSSVISVHGRIPELSNVTQLVKWQSDVDAENQYINEPASWMLDLAVRQLDTVEFDFVGFSANLTRCSQLQDFLNLPLCATPAVVAKHDVVIDEEVHEVTDKNVKRRRPRKGRRH